jgi:hypothetical protein
MFRHTRAHALLLAVGMTVAAASFADSMSTNDYQASKDRIAAQYKAAIAGCASLAGNANDVCEARAKGQQSVALAELEYDRSGTDADRAKVATARSEAAHAIAAEKCDGMAGNSKDVCMKEADAAQTKANADAKLAKTDAHARNEASEEAREADYKVAIEKCDAMAGDAKSACVSRAHSLRSSGQQTTKESIAADAKTAKVACDKLSGNANDVCEARVKGDENVALAELEFRQSGAEADRAAVATAKADAAFSVAKEMCDDKAGNAKDVCLKQADAAHVKANAQAKLSKTDADARAEADDANREADYQVAIEKCDALAGDTKDLCVAESKAKFAKN